jgi:hypothetical protein
VFASNNTEVAIDINGYFAAMTTGARGISGGDVDGRGGGAANDARIPDVVAAGTGARTVATLNALEAQITSNLAIVPTDNGWLSAFASNPTISSSISLDISRCRNANSNDSIDGEGRFAEPGRGAGRAAGIPVPGKPTHRDRHPGHFEQ